MKKGNVTILASILAIALVAAGVGAGTMAWFSAGPVTAGPFTMNTATMSMNLVEAGPYTFTDLVPGQAFGPIVIKITNDGTMDINYLCGSMVITDNIALAGKIEIVDWYEYIPGWGWQDNLGSDYGTTRDWNGHTYTLTQNFDQLVKDQSAPFTLLEAAQSYSISRGEPLGYGILDQFGGYKKFASDWVTGYGYDEVAGGAPAIIKGGTYQMVFYFKFHETAENNLQHTSGSFKITFLGMQDLSQRP